MVNKHLATKALIFCMAIMAFGAALLSSIPTAATTNDTVIAPLATEEPPYAGYVETSSGRPILFAPVDANATWYHLWIGSTDFTTTLYDNWVQKDASKCNVSFCPIVPDAHPLNGTYSMWIQTWGPNGYNNNDANYWKDVGPITISLTAPGLVSQIVTENTSSITGVWTFVPHATWYNVWFGKADFSSQLHYQWHSALELNCNGSGTCEIPLSKEGLESGVPYIWYVQSWGPGGFSTGGSEDGWSHSAPYTP